MKSISKALAKHSEHTIERGREDSRAVAGIAGAVGRTPLVRLFKVFPENRFQFYAKLEAFNPGGSMKDRAAFNIIRREIEAGSIGPRTVVVESSSGNMGIGLAQACRYYGLQFICVIDPKTTCQNRALLEAYGAIVDVVTEPHPTTGEFLMARLARVRELMTSYPDAFWPNQYANLHNAEAHYATMDEIVGALHGNPDYLFCAVSTCGTLRGCMNYLRSHNASTKVIAVDAVGSVIFGGPRGKRLLPGHGAAVRPGLYLENIADVHVLVSDMDCVVGCRRLASTEAIVAGGSSGGVLMAVQRLWGSIKEGATCVAIFADRGERYLDTVYSDDWVQKNLGPIPDMSQEFIGGKLCAIAES
jgi:2,3-diaminopropionate biosynthesis protein SbnA